MSKLTRVSLELATKQLRGNPGRGLYKASDEATEAIESCREAVAGFIHAQSSEEIIFTSGTTESLNTVARWYDKRLQKDDEIIVSVQEHHSNFLPWFALAQRTGAKIVCIKPEQNGALSWTAAHNAINPRTKIVALSMIGNVYGYLNQLDWVSLMAHKAGAVLVVDAAQAAMHTKIDVQKMDCDFLAFSGHKMGAPFGIGVLYAKKALQACMEPVCYGGGMVEGFDTKVFRATEPPYCFEAGTRNPFACIGLSSAIMTLNLIGMDIIKERERDLTEALIKELDNVPGVHIIGGHGVDEHHSLVSFTLDGVHAHDVASIMADNNVYVRAGQMCAQPLINHLGVPAVVRASVALYNSFADVAKFGDVLKTVRHKMGVE